MSVAVFSMGNCKDIQHKKQLTFRHVVFSQWDYIISATECTIPLLLKFEISNFQPFSKAASTDVLDLVGNPNDQFCCVPAHIKYLTNLLID